MERSHEPFFHPALVTKFFPKPVLVPDFLMAYKFLWQLKFNIHFAKVQPLEFKNDELNKILLVFRIFFWSSNETYISIFVAQDAQSSPGKAKSYQQVGGMLAIAPKKLNTF